MTQATTPIGVGSTYTSGASTIDVTWSGPITGGNGTFIIQFVNKTNPGDIFIAPGSPFPIAAPAGSNYSQTVTFATAALATQYSAYQAQVQAVAAVPADNSAWGLQTWWDWGVTVTITIGSRSFTLTELPAGGVYKLPVTAANPLTVTYAELNSFVTGLNWGLTLPTSIPNGTATGIPLATTALNLSRFVVDTNKKTFAFDIAMVADWELFPGFTFNSVGLDIQRTDGTPLPM